MSRLTLVTSNPVKADLDWRGERQTPLAFVESIAAVRIALAATTTEELDIARVIIDRAGGVEDFLDLLTRVPAEFLGDLLLIRDDGCGYLSATGRGGNRVLYALTAHDIRFYLETHDLVTGRVIIDIRKTA